jgi:hypothetical protein
MSASEKLKVLEKGLEEAMRSSDEYGEAINIVDGYTRDVITPALPKIMALVKAAEELPTFFTAGGHVHSFDPLLDDLEKVLP